MADDKDFRDILAYLQETLPAKRRAAFEERLRTDANLREQVNLHRRSVNGLQKLATRHRMELIRRESDDRLTVIRPFYQQPWFAGAVAAGVLLLLIVGVSLYRTQFSPARQAFVAYYRPDVGFRGGGSARCVPGLEPAIQQYELEEYEQALTVVNQLADTSAACVQYQKGLILLALGEPEPAIRAFRRISGSPDVLLRQKADWYLSLAYLRNNDSAAARQLLDRIRNESNHPFASSAQRLANQLSE